MRSLKNYEAGFLGGWATVMNEGGVTVLMVGAVRRARDRRIVAGNTFSADSLAPSGVELDAQPAPEGNMSESPRLESEMDDVMLPSQRW